MKRKTIFAIGLLFTLSLILAACGGAASVESDGPVADFSGGTCNVSLTGPG